VFVGAVFASLFEALTSAQLELQRAVFVANAELADLERQLAVRRSGTPHFRPSLTRFPQKPRTT